MFSKKANPTFDVRVDGFVPGKPGDGMKVIFKHKTRDEYEAWVKSFAGEPLIKRMAEVTAGWEDAPSEYSEAELFATADEYPGLAQVMFQKYTAGLFGAQQKN